MERTDKKSITGRVQELIKTGKTKMRPKAYFIMRMSLLMTGILVVALTLLYLASFIFFMLRQTGTWFIPEFGLRGFHVFIQTVPWILIIVLALFIVILEMLVKYYSFAYRRPIVYSVIAIIACIVAGGFVIARTPLHNVLFRQARDRTLPFAGGLYRNFGMPRMDDVHPGRITVLGSSGFTIETPRGDILVVAISSETRFPLGTDLDVDDNVVVFGPIVDATVEALGIRRVDETIEPFQFHERPRRSSPPLFFP